MRHAGQKTYRSYPGTPMSRTIYFVFQQKRNPVRISVSHNRSKEEVIQAVDRSINDVFKDAGALPVKLVMEQRSWQGSVMSFALTAKMGIISTPIKGTVEVTDRDIIIDADLGMFNRFVDEKTAQQVIGTRLKGLLT